MTVLTLGIDIGGSSVKAALLADGKTRSVARSDLYERPARDALELAIGQAAGMVLEGLADPVDRIGLCAPGILDRPALRITRAVNVPGLEGLHLPELIARAIERAARVAAPRRLDAITSDTHATALDMFLAERLAGRLLCIALGTGVGASVLDDPDEPGGLPRPLHISGETPGHIGHLDVSLDDDPPEGPDGAHGTLESYIGLVALKREGAIRVRESGEPEIDPDRLERPLRALARALRICHAMYRPTHVRLAGGVGVRLAPFLPGLRERVDRGLTSLAGRDATLGVAPDDYCAARGAAILAASVH